MTGARPDAAAVRIATEPVTVNAHTLGAVPGRRGLKGTVLWSWPCCSGQVFDMDRREQRGPWRLGKHGENQACSESSTEKCSTEQEDWRD